MQILVTGATGFVGWHVAARLRAGHHRVRALVRSPEKAERLLGRLGIAPEDRVAGDMTDPAAVDRALEGCEAAVHTAATVSVGKGAGSGTFDANVTGAKLVLGRGVERGLGAVVFVSSLTAIFEPGGGDTTTDSPVVRSATRYGRSKADSDAFARALQDEGAPLSIVYPSAILGPDDPGLSESVRAFRGFLRTMIDSEGGTQFVDARDLALLIERLVEGRSAGRVIAAGPYFAWSELAHRIEDVTGAEIRRLRAPGWLLRTAGSLADALARVTGRPGIMTREAMEIATRWRPIADSKGVAAAGVTWRPPEETLADLYRSLVANERLPARAVPRLAQEEQRP